MDIFCKLCKSENVYFSKKKKLYICEDCEEEFTLEKEFSPQKVFLSYGHDTNQVLINKIKCDLEERGHLPWIDYSEIREGNDWRTKISEGIRKSQNFFAFISKHSTRIPGVCLDEISIGLGSRNCHIQTVILEKDAIVPNSISSIQWLDMSEWRKYYKISGNIWEKWYQDKIRILFDVIEDERNHRISGEITMLESILKPFSTESKLKIILREEIFGREWLTKRVFEWYNEDRGSRVFLIGGAPGTGKSVFAAILSNFMSNCCSVFFCEWNNSETRNPAIVIKSLAFQMACNIKDYRELLINILKSKNFDGMSFQTLMDFLLIDPLNSLIDGGREDNIIVIDALDEAGENEYNLLVELLIQKIDNFPSWIRFVMTSRLERNIMSSFKKYKPFVLDIENKNNLNDISKYISYYINNKDDANEILLKSCGCILFAKELVRAVLKNEICIANIDTLPDNMSGIYYENFKRIFHNNNEYRFSHIEFLCVLLASYEPLTMKELNDILHTSEYKINQICDKLDSFFKKIEKSSDVYIMPFHKSISDWLTSDSAGIYKIYKTDGLKLISEKIIQIFDKKEKTTEYFMKYGLDHLQETGIWNKYSYQKRMDIIEYLINEAVRHGSRNHEFKYIERWKSEFGDNEKRFYLSSLIDYYIKVEGSMVENTINDLLEELDNEADEIKRYFYIENIAKAYFYIGLDLLGMNILQKEKKKHDSKFWEDDKISASYNHTLGLLAHDLDLNETVVNLSKTATDMYTKQNKYYSNFVTRVNLFDGLMAIGRLEEAENIALKIFNDNEQQYFIHIDDILNICYGNLLMMQGRIIEALLYYEIGLKLAIEIQEWDYLYGSIWRELSLAKFGDRSCLSKLLELKLKSQNQNYKYLESLAICYYFNAFYCLETDIQDEDVISLYYRVLDLGMPGHIVQVLIVCLLKEFYFDKETVLVDNVVSNILKCEGIKGCPELIVDFMKKYSNILPEKVQLELKTWILKYVEPILVFREELNSEIFNTLSNEPYLNKYDCIGCEAKCCYDGVYISDKEEKDIIEFIKDYPDAFYFLPDDYIVNGTWSGMSNERKTAVFEYSYKDKNYPNHFTKTRCVFAYENGECSLQRLATDNQLFPWKVKPIACWSFPIQGVIDGKIIPPPAYGEQDPNYIDENYPGYETYLPCAKAQLQGASWKSFYKNEIYYYQYLIKNSKL